MLRTGWSDIVTMNSHIELRDSLERTAARIIKAGILPAKTCLAGGTAVSFYLNHRLSHDLDFFTSNSFRPETILHQIRQTFNFVQLEVMEADTLLAHVAAARVKFSLFHLPYPVLDQPVSYQLQNEVVCPLASFADVITMKCIAIAQRGSAKDFVDLYYLLQRTGTEFDDVFSLVRKKYAVQDSYAYQLKTSLVYFEDAEKEIRDIRLIRGSGVEHMDASFWDRVKMFFQEFIQ